MPDSLPVVETGPIEIVFHGRVPSKKNSKRYIKRGRQIIPVPSKQYAQWEQAQLNDSLYGLPQVPWSRVHADFEMWAPDRRKADLSNKFESVADAAVEAGVISDDNWFVLSSVNMRFRQVDAKEPRVVLTLSNADDLDSDSDYIEQLEAAVRILATLYTRDAGDLTEGMLLHGVAPETQALVTQVASA